MILFFDRTTKCAENNMQHALFTEVQIRSTGELNHKMAQRLQAYQLACNMAEEGFSRADLSDIITDLETEFQAFVVKQRLCELNQKLAGEPFLLSHPSL